LGVVEGRSVVGKNKCGDRVRFFCIYKNNKKDGIAIPVINSKDLLMKGGSVGLGCLPENCEWQIAICTCQFK
jgi:hypothetical protein